MEHVIRNKTMSSHVHTSDGPNNGAYLNFQWSLPAPLWDPASMSQNVCISNTILVLWLHIYYNNHTCECLYEEETNQACLIITTRCNHLSVLSFYHVLQVLVQCMVHCQACLCVSSHLQQPFSFSMNRL